MERKPETRRLLASCGVILVVMFLCLSLVSMGYATLALQGSPIFPGKQTSTLPLPIDDTNADDQQPTPRVVFTPVSPALDKLHPEIAQQMDLIQEQVSELRELSSKGYVTRLLLTRDELRQHLIDDFNEDYSLEEAKEDVIVLSAFGLLENDFDLYNFFLELYTEQISGFYDTETKEMYVVLDQKFSGINRLTYAHEFVHALQDQHFDIREGLGYNDEDCEEDSERCAAIQALLEGDASLMELHWFSAHATQQDFTDIQEYFQTYESPIFDSAPVFIQADLMFPYMAGQTFVEHIYQTGGWEAVNQVYLDVPVSTAQILHPERYPNVKPLSVHLPDITNSLGEGWRELDRGVLGEWYTRLILANGHDPHARLDESQVESATKGWSGDAYMVYYNNQKDETAMVLMTIWENEAESTEFTDSFLQYATARFGQPVINQADIITWETDETYTRFHIFGDTTVWIFTNNEETGQAVWSALP
jgi:hypothetical protein